MVAPTFLCVALVIGLLRWTLAQNDGTCSATTECDQGCCSSSGSCGFGPDYCGDDVCVSNCDAKAECGEYAPKGEEKCPLNVCCSKWGFCGTTEEFCGDDCQEGCDPVDRPSCSGSRSDKYGGYYASWCTERPCDVLQPSNINAAAWSHLYYSFALINPDDFSIMQMNDYDTDLYADFVALKKKNAALKTYIAVGGWDAGGKIFSLMAKFPGGRSTFIKSAIDLMEEYGFDGIDIDWEYPVALDRGGAPEDYKNYVTLLKELKEACGDKYGVSIAIPASYWYLRHFDVSALQEHVDWFNFMSYDIHGLWDGDSPWTKRVVNPHTNVSEIAQGLDLLWRNKVKPEKVMLGLGFYGRSFALSDPSCNTPGCPFAGDGGGTGGADPGACTGVSGTLSLYEIERIIRHNSPERVYDADAMVNWMTWNSDQWISFDDSKTLYQKATFADGLCLGGTFAWSVDLGGPGTLGNPNTFDPDSTGVGGADPNGDGLTDGGSGDVYISPDIYKESNPEISCYPPCTFILPPFTLESETTISVRPWTTSLEVGWTTTITTTLPGGEVSTSTGFTKITQTTTLEIPPITTDAIEVSNYIVKGTTMTEHTRELTTSIILPPIIVTNDPNPLSESGVSHPPVSRTITPPPHPHTTSHDPGGFPIVTVKPGPPGPLCKTGCGGKCKIFCNCVILCPGKGGGGGGGSGFPDPNNPKPGPDPNPDPDPDPEDPEDPCDPDFDSSSGMCPTGNYPVWDPVSNSVRCDIPADRLDEVMTGCQANIDDSFDDSQGQIDDAQAACEACGLPGLARRQAPPVCHPGNKSYDREIPEGASCHKTYYCPWDRFPNICANAKSAIVHRGKPSVLTFTPNDRPPDTTKHWYDNKFGVRPDGSLEGWGLLDCNVEEYPFASGNPIRRPNMQTWDEAPVVRLVPKDENRRHGLDMTNFHREAAEEVHGPGIHESAARGLVYCVDFTGAPSGTSNEDLLLGSNQDQNICGVPYGPEFLVVNNARVSGRSRRWDPWWDDKLFDHRVPSGATTALPSQYCKHPSPGKKTYVNNQWTTSGGGAQVGTAVASSDGRQFWACDTYPGFSADSASPDTGRGRRFVPELEPGLPKADKVEPATSRKPEKDEHASRTVQVPDNSTQGVVMSPNGVLEVRHKAGVARRQSGGGSFLDGDAFRYLGCESFDGDDMCQYNPACDTPGDSGPGDGGPDPPDPTTTSVITTSSNCKICTSTVGHSTSSCSFEDGCSPVPTRLPVDDFGFCAEDHQDEGGYVKMSWDDVEGAMFGLCDAGHTLSAGHPSGYTYVYTNLDGKNVLAHAGWADDQSGCAKKKDVELSGDWCYNGVIMPINICDDPDDINQIVWGGAAIETTPWGCLHWEIYSTFTREGCDCNENGCTPDSPSCCANNSCNKPCDCDESSCTPESPPCCQNGSCNPGPCDCNESGCTPDSPDCCANGTCLTTVMFPLYVDPMRVLVQSGSSAARRPVDRKAAMPNRRPAATLTQA